MSDKTKIEWSDATWNPITGCTRVSEGCRNCYIDRSPPFRIAKRRFLLNGEPSGEVGATTGVTLHPDRLDQPLRWKRPRRVFVNSLSDLFHAAVPFDFIAQVFAVMARSPEHTFQVLTKRPGRMAALLSEPAFGFLVEEHAGEAWITPPGEAMVPLENVWLGVSAEDQEAADKRIPVLLDTPAAVRFLSCEPLLGPIDLEFPSQWTYDEHAGPIPTGARADIHWVIVGGESGPGARPMHPDWARSLRDQCVAADVPFFFKQWGEYIDIDQAPRETANAIDARHNLAGNPVVTWRVGKKAAGRELDGRTWDEMPERSGVLA